MRVFISLIYLLFFSSIAYLMYFLILTSIARGEDARCHEVRSNVARYGVARASAWARTNGYTEAQIIQARQCLRRAPSFKGRTMDSESRN
jgi:hypothetical protein